MFNSSASATFGASVGGDASSSSGGNSRYIRENNLQYIFRRADEEVRAKTAGRRLTKEQEEQIVREALLQVQAETKKKEDAIAFSSSCSVKSGSHIVIGFTKKVVQGELMQWSAAVAYKSKSGPLNAVIPLNSSQMDTAMAIVKRFAPHTTTTASTTTSSDDNPPISLETDGTVRPLDGADGQIYRILDDLISHLREVRQEGHTRRMFVPL